MEGLTIPRVVAYAKLAKGANISITRQRNSRLYVEVLNGTIMATGRLAAVRCSRTTRFVRLKEVVDSLQWFEPDDRQVFSDTFTPY